MVAGLLRMRQCAASTDPWLSVLLALCVTHREDLIMSPADAVKRQFRVAKERDVRRQRVTWLWCTKSVADTVSWRRRGCITADASAVR